LAIANFGTCSEPGSQFGKIKKNATLKTLKVKNKQPVIV